MRPRLPLLVILALAATPAAAQVEDSTDPSPVPARAHHQLVHHASQGRVYLIGGSTPGDGGHRTFDDVWSWDGEAWRPAPPLPFPRSSHRVVYEPAGESLLLFGGMDGDSVRADGVVWQWRAEEWVERARVPEAGRNEPGACMDADRSRLVLFGGADREGAFTGSTWEWDGAEMREIALEGPGPRLGHAMAWDPAGGRCLLFGGRDPNGVVHGDTWAWDGGAWSRLDVDGPPARWIFTMTDDGERVLLFGGQDGDEELLGDTWSWDGETWSRIATDGADPRMMAAMAFDGRGVLLFGGRGRGVESRYRDRGDTWRLEGDRWRLLIPTAGVRALERAYTAAWEANDREAVMALVAEGAAIVPGGMAPIVGREAIEAFWFPSEGPATTVTRYTTEIDEAGGAGDVEWARGRGVLSFRWEDEDGTHERTSRSAFLMVAERGADGEWRIRNRISGRRRDHGSRRELLLDRSGRASTHRGVRPGLFADDEGSGGPGRLLQLRLSQRCRRTEGQGHRVRGVGPGSRRPF